MEHPLLRVIIFGVYNKHAPKVKKRLKGLVEIVEILSPEERRNFREKPKADIGIILKRLASKDNFKDAEILANHIPIVEADTENYVEQELERQGFIKKAKASVEPKIQESAEVSKPEIAETKVGLSAEELWEKYSESAVTFIESAINPGERIDEEILITSMSELIGLPEDDCKHLLPQLAAKGYVVNTVGTTWKRTGGTGKDYEYAEDTVEAPKGPRKPIVRELLVSKIQGLHPGPYPSFYAISREMKKYKDFFRQDGKSASDSYRAVIVNWANEAGAIEEKDGKFYVKQDLSVTLTPVEEVPAPVPVVAKVEPPKPNVNETKEEATLTRAIRSFKEVRFPELDKLGGGYVGLSEFKGPGFDKPPKKMDLGNVEEVRKLFKIEQLALMPGQIALIRSLMPNRNWEESAVRAIQKRLVKLGSPLKTLSRELFTNEEWDALAWETLGALPMGIVAVIFRELYEDRQCFCSECGAAFVFTKGEQEHYFRTFDGEVTAPRRCPPCRRSRKEQGPSPHDRVLRRYGE